jgi:hypothetical protein
MSSTLIIIVIGFNFILIFNELREHKKKKDLMKQFSPDEESINKERGR